MYQLEEGRHFVLSPLEALNSYGVIAQEYIEVGDILYLIMLSVSTGELDVYEYIPSQASASLCFYFVVLLSLKRLLHILISVARN